MVKNKKVFLLFSIICVSSLAILPNVYDTLPILQRVFDIQEIIEQETRDGRLSKYLYIISNDGFLTGNGIGSSFELRNKIGASESYLLQIYYEGGALLLANFLFFLFLVLIMSAKYSKKDFIIVSLFCFSLLIVHAFESPVFIVFWGYLLSFYPTVTTPKKYLNTEL
jgi:hypothetical protein